MNAVEKKSATRRKIGSRSKTQRAPDRSAEFSCDAKGDVSSVRERRFLTRDVMRAALLATEEYGDRTRSTRRVQREYQAVAWNFAHSLIKEINAALYGDDCGIEPGIPTGEDV